MSAETMSESKYERIMSEKLEMINERRGSLVIRVFWLKLTNEVSLQLFDKEKMILYEDLIPNDKVMDAVEHPWVYMGHMINEQPDQSPDS